MRFYVKFNDKCKHNYELFIVDDDNNTRTVELTSKTTDGYLRLPEECTKVTNRKMIAIKQLEQSDGDFELTIKELNEKSQKVTKSTTNWQQYLTDDERAIFDELKSKCELRMKKNSILSQIEMYQKMLKECEN
jgi:predicted RNA-binding protein with RPS1 domain